MKNGLLVFLVLLIGLTGLLLTACSGDAIETEDYVVWYGVGYYDLKPQEAYAGHLREIGLFGEHQLERHKIDSNLKGSFSGSFFLASGGISGEIGSYDYLKFAWRTQGNRIIVSSLPLNKIVVVIDETQKTPTIKFKFKLTILYDHYRLGKLTNEGADFNQNVFIDSQYISYAVVRINSEDLEKEIYLPFNKK